MSDSQALRSEIRCIESFADARGALKASKSLLLIHLRQLSFPIFYIGE